MKKDPKVRVSNALIDACYNPESLYQMRLFLSAVAQIRDGQELTHNTEFEVSAQAIADLVGISGRSGSHFGHLRRAADELMRKHITVYEHHDGRKRGKRYTKINFVSHCIYLEDEAKVFLQFTPSIIPYITQLRDRYATYLLKTAMKMKSGYGIRLYEMCHRWNFGSGEKEFAVDEFRQLMGLENQYRIVRDLRNRVILPAIRDVNKHTEFTVSFGQRKSGRTITHLQFKIQRKKTRKAVEASVALPGVARGKDFQKYADAVLPNAPLGKRYTNKREAEAALQAELDEGTIRDLRTGKIIQRRGEPVAD